MCWMFAPVLRTPRARWSICRDARANQKQYEACSEQGYRVVGVAYRDIGAQKDMAKEDEKEMRFLGFLTLFDPIKPEP